MSQRKASDPVKMKGYHNFSRLSPKSNLQRLSVLNERSEEGRSFISFRSKNQFSKSPCAINKIKSIHSITSVPRCITNQAVDNDSCSTNHKKYSQLKLSIISDAIKEEVESQNNGNKIFD